MSFARRLGARLKGCAAPALLFALGWLAWRNTLENGFVYDDEVNIVQNEAIRSLTPLAKFFDPNSSSADAKMNAGLWRPLTRLVWALDYRAGGLDPKPYHATNLFLHLLNDTTLFKGAICAKIPEVDKGEDWLRRGSLSGPWPHLPALRTGLKASVA